MFNEVYRLQHHNPLLKLHQPMHIVNKLDMNSKTFPLWMINKEKLKTFLPPIITKHTIDIGWCTHATNLIRARFDYSLNTN
jgi:hypothetical protein